MTAFAAALLIVLQGLAVSVWDGGESSVARHNRQVQVAIAIDAYTQTLAASNPIEIAAATIAIGDLEANFAGYVGRGECDNPPEGAPNCDRDNKRKVARARTYFQLHESTCRTAWALPQGSPEELHAAVRCAARHWMGGLRSCAGKHPDGDIAGAFSGYRRQNHCTWSEGKKRAGVYANILADIYRAQAHVAKHPELLQVQLALNP